MASAHYHVYVVELRPRADTVPRLPDVYVGSTHLAPTLRFQKHRAHEHGSRHVRRRGIRLRPDLTRGMDAYPTRDAAYDAEHALAAKLTRAGHRVYGACSPRTSPTCVM